MSQGTQPNLDGFNLPIHDNPYRPFEVGRGSGHSGGTGNETAGVDLHGIDTVARCGGEHLLPPAPALDSPGLKNEQWNELQRQVMVDKYMNSYTSHNPAARKVVVEPGRCRRTDGKGWRCSKEAIVKEKYCEDHVHRSVSRYRSRKHVEISNTKDTNKDKNKNKILESDEKHKKPRPWKNKFAHSPLLLFNAKNQLVNSDLEPITMDTDMSEMSEAQQRWFKTSSMGFANPTNDSSAVFHQSTNTPPSYSSEIDARIPYMHVLPNNNSTLPTIHEDFPTALSNIARLMDENELEYGQMEGVQQTTGDGYSEDEMLASPVYPDGLIAEAMGMSPPASPPRDSMSGWANTTVPSTSGVHQSGVSRVCDKPFGVWVSTTSEN